MIRERIKAGLQRARAQGKRLGRAKVDDDVDRAVRASLAAGTGILKTARTLGIGTKTDQGRDASRVAR
jgi:DNA invertase Pin-like site-specific DNA recombinase